MIPQELKSQILIALSGVSRAEFSNLERLLIREDADPVDIINHIRPWSVLVFRDPEQFLEMLESDPEQLRELAQRALRVKKLIEKLNQLPSPKPAQGGAG